MSVQQLAFPMTQQPKEAHLASSYREQLHALLSGDLDFHGKDSGYASHNFHAFPAKFPPQLPRAFIEELTAPGDIVLDPMVGSGTTIVEAFLSGRRGIGFDIDPMALRLCRAKVTPLPPEQAAAAGHQVLLRAQESLQREKDELRQQMDQRFGAPEHRFLDYWFLPDTQLELLALLQEIERLEGLRIREFLELAFSAIIITKSGGVTLARDLAHTRPHKVKDKIPRSPIDEFRKRLNKNLESLAVLGKEGKGAAEVHQGDAQSLPLEDQSVDLIVTSPPYAANAIDYMRAHKFSLVWFGHSLESLTMLRREYIGHDAALGVNPLELPVCASQVVASIALVDSQKASSLRRYYSEMTRCLAEMARVLKPGKVAIVVVGSSTMRGIDTRTDICLGEIGKGVGFELVGIASRKLDRNRRMLPVRHQSSGTRSQIEQRMHEEYVLGFLKPA